MISQPDIPPPVRIGVSLRAGCFYIFPKQGKVRSLGVSGRNMASRLASWKLTLPNRCVHKGGQVWKIYFLGGAVAEPLNCFSQKVNFPDLTPRPTGYNP